MSTTTKSKVKIIIPDAAALAARQRTHDAVAAQQYAKSMRYDRRAAMLEFELRNDTIVRIPIAAIDQLAKATPAQLAEVKLSPTGGAIQQRDLDVDLSVPGLLRSVFGFGEIQQRRAARAKSPAKAAAARANGAKGGRPRKTAEPV